MRTFAIARLKWSHLSGHALRHPPSLCSLSVSLYPTATLRGVTFTLLTHLLRMSSCSTPARLQLCWNICMCEHVCTCTRYTAGLSHDWIHNSPPFLSSSALSSTPLWHPWILSRITSYMTPNLSLFSSSFTFTTPPFPFPALPFFPLHGN